MHSNYEVRGVPAWLLAFALMACAVASVFGQPIPTGKIGRTQAAEGTAFYDAVQTWTQPQTQTKVLTFTEGSTPTRAGQIGLADGALCVHDGSGLVNLETGGGGGGATNLDGLSDVTITSAAQNQFFARNASSWVNVNSAGALSLAVSGSSATWTLTTNSVTTGSIEDATITAADIGDAELAALGGLTSAADRLPYFTGSGTAALATFTAAGRALVDDADAAAQLTTLGVSVFVQTILDDADASAVRTTIGAQPLDTELTALAGLASAADKLPYFDGAGTAAVTDFTATARTLLDDGSTGAMRTTLGLVIGTDVQAFDAELAALAGLTSAANKGIQFTGAGTAGTYDLTTAGKALLDDADASAQLTTLGFSTFTKTLVDDTTAGAFLTTLGVSAFAQTILDDADAGTARATLGLGAVGGTSADLGASASNGSGTDIALANHVHKGVVAQDEGSNLDSGNGNKVFNFAGAGVSAAATGGTVTVTIPGSGTATITVQNADSTVSAVVDTIDFGAVFTVTESPTGEANVSLDTELTAIAGLTSAADKGIQFTGAGTAGTYDLTAAGKALLDDADASAQRTTLGLVIGTDVQAFDAELAALAGLTSAADRLPYFTGSGTATLATFTAAGRALVDDADAAAQLTTLGVSAFVQTVLDDADAATVRATISAQQSDAELTAIAGLTSAADKGIQFTGAGTAATYDLTTAGKALLDDADATAQRATLGLVIGTNVQAFDAELAALAGLTSAADKGIQFTGAGTAATYDLTAAGKALLDDATAGDQLTTLGVSAFAQTILDDANASAARATLGLGAVGGTSQDLGASASNGSGTDVALANHVHKGLIAMDEGSDLDSGNGVKRINFEGGGVSAAASTGTVTVTIPAGVSDLDGLSDVTITSAAQNQIIARNASGFVNASSTGALTVGVSGNTATWFLTTDSVTNSAIKDGAVTGVKIGDPELSAIAGVTSLNDKSVYFTGTGTAATYTLTQAGRDLLDDADASAMRTTLGLVIGTNVQAFDAELAALAGLTSAANKGIQFTGSGTAATYDLTAAGKALLDDADASAQLTTLGVSTFAKTILDDADAGTVRATIGIGAVGGTAANLGTEASNGSGTDVALSNHVHKGPAALMDGSSAGVQGVVSIDVANGLSGYVNAAGTFNVSPTYGTGVGQVATASSQGSAANLARGDHAHKGASATMDGVSAGSQGVVTIDVSNGLKAYVNAAGTLNVSPTYGNTAGTFQQGDAELGAIAGLTSAADKGIQFTGSGTASTYDLTTAGKALLDDADASAQLTTLGFSAFTKTLVDDVDAAAVRTTLGLVIGTDVQAQDAELAALAGLTSAANKGIQFTGAGTAGTYDLTAAGKAILDDATAGDQLTTLGVSAFAQTLLDDADASAVRATLGFGAIGGTATAVAAASSNGSGTDVALANHAHKGSTVMDEAALVGSGAGLTNLNFEGAGVSAAMDTSGNVTVTVPGGSTPTSLDGVYLINSVFAEDASGTNGVTVTAYAGLDTPTLNVSGSLDVERYFALGRRLVDDELDSTIFDMFGSIYGSGTFRMWTQNNESNAQFGAQMDPRGTPILVTTDWRISDTLQMGSVPGNVTVTAYLDGTLNVSGTALTLNGAPMGGLLVKMDGASQGSASALDFTNGILASSTGVAGTFNVSPSYGTGITQVGTASAAGTAENIARTDHVHKGASAQQDGASAGSQGVVTINAANGLLAYVNAAGTLNVSPSYGNTAGTVQQGDAELGAIAGLTSAADKGIQFTGSGTAATYDLTTAGKALLDDATAGDQRATLGLVIGTNVQAFDADLSAIAGLTSAADRLPYFTGSGTADVAVFTAAARAFLDDANTAAQLTTLGVSAFVQTTLDDTDASTFRGTIGAQASDAELTALAGLTSTADKGIQFTGVGTAATYDLTAAGKAILDDADATAQRATLGLVIGTDVQGIDAELTAIAGLTSAADKGIQFTGAGTAGTYDLTAFAKTFLDDADASAARATLGLGTVGGTSADLGTAANNGSGTNIALANHVHKGPASQQDGVSAGSQGIVTINASNGLKAYVNAAGTFNVSPSYATPTSLGTSNSAGSADTIARSDHVHKGLVGQEESSNLDSGNGNSTINFTGEGSTATASGGTLTVTIPGVPAGTIVATARNSPAPGWQFCDGTAVSRATYATLFSAICKTGTVSSVDTGGETITSNSHGLFNNDVIKLYSTSGTSVPGGLTEGTVYYVVGKTANTVQLSTTAGGSAVNLTSAGSGTITWISAPYGDGDGETATTFNLPNFQGRVLAGADSTQGGTAADLMTASALSFQTRSPGASGGAQTHTLTSAEIPAHTHPTSESAHSHGVTYARPTDVGVRNDANQVAVASSSLGTTTASASTGLSVSNNTGGGGAHRNVQPTIMVYWMIKE